MISPSASPDFISIKSKLNIPVVVAGSIDSFERIDAMKQIRPWGFTIGSAFFDKKFDASGSFREQLIIAYNYLNIRFFCKT